MSESSGIRWLGIASRPIVANTAVSASSSGSPAATSAPKREDQDDQGDRHREEAGGLEVVDDRLVELRLDVDAELLDRNSGWRAAAAISACSTGASSVFAFVRSVVRSSSVTSAVWRSFEI